MCASVRYVACVIISTDVSTVQSAVVNVYQPQTLLSHLCHSHDSQERKVTISLNSIKLFAFLTKTDRKLRQWELNVPYNSGENQS
jgi:hypothetical protein